MNIWRMKLRAGTYGEDMWPSCRDRGLASMTHPPIYDTDLTHLKKEDVDPAVRTAARSSIWRFAWDIRGGDVIYVGDSKTRSIIARGFVTSEIGMRAYRYNPGAAVTEPSNPQLAWRHEISVEWDKNFTSFLYRDPAPRYTVIPFQPPIGEAADGQRVPAASGVVAESMLNEFAYMRETEASKGNILRLHASLSNQFRKWLERSFGVKVIQETRHIDLRFERTDRRHLAELKICYGENTKHAIREAIGQLFEYNHYPSYEEAHFWWLVLDCKPSATDCNYISVLRKRYRIPLTIAWQNGDKFEAYPALPFENLPL